MPDLDRAAEIIHQCILRGEAIDYDKADLWPDTVDQAYQIQAQLEKLHNEPVVGWKIAATAIAGRDHINVDRPLAGRLFQSICHTDSVKLPFGQNRMAVAEAEFVFTLGHDLPSRKRAYSEEEVVSCIKSLHPGLEFPDSRFNDFTLPGTTGLIADNACAAQFVLGEPSSHSFDPHSLGVHKTRLLINDVAVTNGIGADALDGPLNALVWITNTLSELGIGLKAGQFVTTGVTGLPSPIKVGDHVCADLGVHGMVSATLV